MNKYNETIGNVLLNEFMIPTGINLLQLNTKTDIPTEKLLSIIQNKSTISAFIDEKLCEVFKLQKGYFLKIQNLSLDK